MESDPIDFNQNIDTQTLIQAIGNHLYDLVGDDNKKIIAYSEAESNVVSCSIFYSKELEEVPTYLAGDSDLITIIYELWTRSQNEFGDFWSALCYCIVDGNVHMEMAYKDTFNSDIDRLERRDIVVEKYFGAKDVNYGSF